MRIGQAERAVYLVMKQNGGRMSPEESALFIRTLRAMVSSRLARRNSDGSHELISTTTAPIANKRTEPPPAPAEELVTVSARLPPEAIALLDGINAKNRSEALRIVLKNAVQRGSGTRRVAS